MLPTAVRLSKASRYPLTSKKANKDYYKGSRQAYLPGGHRTGAPGKHVIRGSAKYRIIDEQVRVYVAPPVSEIISSPLKPYVSLSANLTRQEERAVFGRFKGPRGLTPKHFFRAALQHQNQKALNATGVEKSAELVSTNQGFASRVLATIRGSGNPLS